MINRNVVLELFAIFAIANLAVCKLPEYIKLCKKNNPNINACVINSIQHLAQYLKVGIPELNVPSLEPLRINGTIALSIGNEESSILTNLTNLTLYGASTFKILNLWADPNNNIYRYNVSIETLIVNGSYQMNTQLSFLHIAGEGSITIVLGNYNFECLMTGEKKRIEDSEHLIFVDLNCQIQFGTAQVQIENLFNGNELLGSVVNKIVNENIDLFFEEVKPKIIQAISDIFTDVANKITLRFAYEELFPV